MHVFGHFVEGGAEEGVAGEFGIVFENCGGFVFGDFDEAGIPEVAHRDIGETGLTEAKERARTAEFQVFFRQEKSIRARDERLEAIIRSVFAGEEETIGRACATADATAKLMELGESETIGILNDHYGRIGNVDTHLDDGRGDEYFAFPVFEVSHHLLLVGGFHFSIEESDAEFGEDFCGEFFVFGFGGFHFRERGGFFDEGQDDKDLSPLFYFLSREAKDGFSRLVRRGDFGDDGDSIARQFVEDGDVEIAEKGDRKRARNGGRGHGEEVGNGIW